MARLATRATRGEGTRRPARAFVLLTLVVEGGLAPCRPVLRFGRAGGAVMLARAPLATAFTMAPTGVRGLQLGTTRGRRDGHQAPRCGCRGGGHRAEQASHLLRCVTHAFVAAPLWPRLSGTRVHFDAAEEGACDEGRACCAAASHGGRAASWLVAARSTAHRPCQVVSFGGRPLGPAVSCAGRRWVPARLAKETVEKWRQDVMCR